MLISIFYPSPGGVHGEFTPAPDYGKLGITEYIQHSNEVIELSDERLIEIGEYFNNFIKEIEEKEM